ncbi:peptidase [Shewanella baltica]|uniref:PepSY-associated TM helix domain-containing protein n=1 Tax=Shewanella scandinavica TaxID=3063538 RepID=A0ABU3FX16_9GAMM|nr:MULTISPECIES: PepSY-associated TM helix domain-containing protein [Shewanella]KZK70447.1 peptidase [Shewanella baltica]MDT3279904.1 PepSY-associated TM helix domain-containing protein [Shewanella sp. SP2S1-2]
MTRKHKSQTIPTIRYKLARALRPWHRRLGILSCLFILLLVVTGEAINHSQALQLNKSPVQQTWLLDYYGITPPHHIAQFGSQVQPLFVTDNRLWLGYEPILEAQSQLISAAFLSNLLIAIDNDQLYLFDSQGHLQETQNSSTGLPKGLEALAIESFTLDATRLATVNRVWLKTTSGYYQADENLIDWIPAQPLAPLHWVTPKDSVDADLIQYARSANLNWERVMLDLHSGRLFGAYAIWIWDIFGLALLLVSLSGLWLWVKQTKPRR